MGVVLERRPVECDFGYNGPNELPSRNPDAKHMVPPRVFRSSTKTVYSNSVWVETVATTPGSIDGDQTIAASVQPAVLPNVSLAMTAATESSYFWQSAPASSGPWQTISGAAETSYRPGPLTVTTYFRRGFTTPITTVYSNTVCVTVVTVEPGSISGDQTVEDSQQPARLESLVDPSVSSGSLYPFVGIF